MSQYHRRSRFGFGLAVLFAALAPAPLRQQVPPVPVPAPANPDVPANRARVRAEVGAKTFDLVWLYYSENRIDADTVYRWSRRLWEADRDSAADKEGRVAAAQAHLERMLRLAAKIEKIRRLGFGTSLDVLGVDYYRAEAESWRADAQAR